MTTKIVVGPGINKGVKTNRLAFNIDNDSFPILKNAYQWRGRVKRRRGDEFLNRLTRYINSLISSYQTSATTITLDGSGNGNIISGFGLQTNSSIVAGSVIITAPGPTLYTDPDMDGTLSPSGSINYASGEITIAVEAGNSVSVTMRYYPTLPPMGLEDYNERGQDFIQKIGFDPVYAYNIIPNFPYNVYSISFYKNSDTDSVNLPGYIPKTIWSPLNWNGQDYQQFWTTNYEGAFWATNGVPVPFNASTIGMQFKPIVSISGITTGPPSTATLEITGHNLVVGDFVFINEVLTTTGINFQTGYVIAVTDANNVIVEFPNATIATNGTGGIAQYLTSSADPSKDCLRYYDGDPTNGSILSPGFLRGKGWVNFMPPLSQNAFSVGDAPAAIYYLVGAKLMVPYKDRLVFFGPVIQTSTGVPIYLEDTLVFSQNGTPFYTASFTGDPVSSDTVFNPILVPVNKVATASSWFEDQTGFGGYIDSGLDEPINTVGSNEDAILLGFENNQVRMIYTGNDIVPFNLFVINSELGATSTFSIINMDQGAITRGDRGYTITSQTSTQRIDLDNPDQVFQVAEVNNGNERFTSHRDFINEWIYFTYCPNQEDETQYRFPTETFLYNYRDNSWAIFKESYTTYGSFKKQTGFTWATVGQVYPTWSDWNDPWDSGNSTLLQETVIAGTPQGFLMIRATGTGEGPSIAIQNISGNTVTSPDHCLDNGTYIVISGAIGTIAEEVNGKVFSVSNPTLNSFQLNPSIEGIGTYLGLGVIKKLYVPEIQTKQFPVAWELARKTRLGVQQYLFTKTPNAQISLYIYLSTVDSMPFNSGAIVPEVFPKEPENNGLIYRSILYTCPESTNLGLSPANVNLQQINLVSSNGSSQNPQQQIWHRMNTSLIGDVVQIGFTLSDEQMRAVNDEGSLISQEAEIELHAFILNVSPSMLLS